MPEPVYGTVQEESTLDALVSRFVRQIKIFYDNLTGLKLQRDFVATHPELQSEYDDLLNRGSFIDNRIKQAKDLMQQARGWWQWLKDSVGLGAMDDLAALPLIPVAIAAGGAVLLLISKWLTDAYVFSKKITAIQIAERAGGKVSRTMREVLTKGTGETLMEGVRKNLIWVVIGGTILLLGPEILKMMQKRRR